MRGYGEGLSYETDACDEKGREEGREVNSGARRDGRRRNAKADEKEDEMEENRLYANLRDQMRFLQVLD